MLSLSRVTGQHLHPYTERMVGVLVEAMSALEPRALQYLDFHTARMQVSASDFESSRLRLATESPMQAALDGCLRVLDAAQVPRVMGVLREALQFGVGLATKGTTVTLLS